jgi:uncharacterized protein YbaP (TraB family)
MKEVASFPSLLALFLLFAPSALVAQQTNGAQHCLWEAEKGTNKIYLFGTIHFSGSNFFPLPAVVEQAFGRSQTIMFEGDHEEESTPTGRSNTLAAAKFPPVDSLKNHLSAQVYSNVQAYLIQAGVNGSYFDSIKPFMISFSLMDHGTAKLGLYMSKSVDGYLWDKAKREKKRVLPLESLDQKLKLLTNLNDSQQEYMVTETLYQIAETNHIIRDVALAWINGETEKVQKFLFESSRKNPELRKILLTDRNKKWMPSIDAEIKRGERLFIAVGLGHLLGKDSLVDLLSKQGFKVRQL